MFDVQGSEAHAPIEADWKRAHDELVRLGRAQAGLDLEIGRWLLCALRGATHVRLGFASFSEYGGRLLGCTPRMIGERLRVAEALETLPELTMAVAQGQLTWSAAREVTRVATPKTEQEWLQVARDRTVREVEQLVAGRKPGDRPDDPPDPSLLRHVLRFEVSGETMATFREMMAHVRREAAAPLDDDAALLLVARSMLGGPRDDGRANYQVLLQVCPRCQQGTQQADGERMEVSGEVVEMASCDGQELADTHVGRATQTIPPAVRRLVLRRDAGRCRVPGCRHARFVDVHHLDPRAEGGGHEPDNLAAICSAHHRSLHRGGHGVSGRASGELRFFHADGRPYGGVVDPAAAEKASTLFFTLRHLGFREDETKHALRSIATHVGTGESLQALLRRALAVVRPGATHGI